MSMDKYLKHLRSKHKKYVATLIDGTELQANTQKELRKMLSEVDKQEKSSKTEGSVKPKYDPDTGERIN